jgi:hypothetical protein
MVAKLNEPILGIMPFAAIRADEISLPAGALAVVVFRDYKAGAATAGDQKQPQVGFGSFLLRY